MPGVPDARPNTVPRFLDGRVRKADYIKAGKAVAADIDFDLDDLAIEADHCATVDLRKHLNRP